MIFIFYNFYFFNYLLYNIYYMNNLEIITDNEITSFQNDSNINKCIIYTFTFFIIIIFGLMIFVIISMIYNYLTFVFT
jgi:hypothetical protein